MKVYLDNNIFVYFETGLLKVSDLEYVLGQKISHIFYSFSHIQELMEIRSNDKTELNEWVNKRLFTLESYTQDRYLMADEKGTIFEHIVNPKNAYEYFKNDKNTTLFIKDSVNSVTEEYRNIFREMAGVNPKEVNNYSPSDVIEQLSKEIPNSEGMNFIELFERAKLNFSIGDTFNLSHKFAALFEILDLIGYWKDKFTEKSNFARALDASHCFHASYCDYFFTNDKNTFNKSRVAYEMFNIPTKSLLQKPSK